MQIEIDLSTIPPTTALREPDDFGRFEVMLRGVDGYAFVTPDVLHVLAGARAEDPRWRARFEGMLGYAATKGWVRESDGAIRAHIETEQPT